jgi:uncharacterized protein
MGPVKLRFKGKADIVERDQAAKRLVIDASGADERGRGQASMVIRAQLRPVAQGTKVDLEQDLRLSGAAAQYGRGMISDVTTVLTQQFATNMQRRMEATDSGQEPVPMAATVSSSASAAPASGFAIGLRAARMGLARVFARFFKPYQPRQS